MLPVKLQLANYNQSMTRSPDALYFERRCCHRQRTTGWVTTLITDPQPPKEYHYISSLQLHDQSETGLGAISQEPIAPGRHITLFFSPHGHDRGFDLVGTVVRCIPKGEKYEVGISLRQRLAA